MLESLVRAALKQRLVVCVIAVMLLFFGLNAATKLSVDAFPDVTNVQVQIATDNLALLHNKMIKNLLDLINPFEIFF
jgi:Cu/Ag efflux pump CusA